MKEDTFDVIANGQVEASFAVEVRAFLRENRKWWLLPICFCLLAMGALLALSSSAAAPFIYTLF